MIAIPTPDEMPTAFFAKLHAGLLTDGNGETVGIAIPSYSHPGAILLCLRTDLIELLTSTQTALPSPASSPKNLSREGTK